MSTRVSGCDGGRRILYLMHVDWGWIKQRPQHLAEELSENHHVQVLCRFHPQWSRCRSFRQEGPPVWTLLPLPWAWKPISWVANWTQRLWVTAVARRFRPDTIWLTHPSLLSLVPRFLLRLPIIYDCMDDALAFECSRRRLQLLRHLEESLARDAALIFCSSESLRQRLVERYGLALLGKTAVVRNGVSETLLAAARQGTVKRPPPQSHLPAKIAYIGTIGPWLDIALLVRCLNVVPTVEFHLVGPIVGVSLPRHARLKYRGVVLHDRLSQFATGFDAFVMPFRIQPLTEVVDPVKLYEYLALGREVIAIRSAETERFAEFVHLYQSDTEFVHFMTKLTTGGLPPKNTPEVVLPFLAQNTWQARAREISEWLRTLPQDDKH
jgi:teichuronic acid biosynthesis glycosyltransferase TuaH